MTSLTVGITTKNRPEALATCLASMNLLTGLAAEILVFDDASAPRCEPERPAGAPPIRVIHDARAPGYIVGRNRLMREAVAQYVLLLDDDTKILSRESIAQGMRVLESDPRAGAVAFAQANADGTPWAAAMQASRAASAAIVPSFIGFAHLLRRDLFLSLGGYREDFVYYGEEKDFCLRLLDAGYRTVYLPAALVAHIPAPAGRSPSRYLRFVARNDCLNALYNDPIPRVLWSVPARFFLYFRMRRGWRIPDPWGWVWLARELLCQLPRVAATRRPVSRATLRAWRSLRRAPVPYPAEARS